MLALFSCAGRIGRIPYALASIGVFSSQHLVVWLIYAAVNGQLRATLGFYLNPLPTVVELAGAKEPLFLVTVIYMLIVAWGLAILAFRRAADADINGWTAILATVPLMQIPVILFLSLVPTQRTETRMIRDPLFQRSGWGWAPAVQGMIAGMGLTVFAVAVGALVFGIYGYGMFVISPIVIGATAGYFANRDGDVGEWQTIKLVAAAASLGGIALVMTALEGAVCIIMAAPIAIPVAVLGGMLGRALALYTTRSASRTLSSFAILPMVFASEAVLPPSATFDTCQTVEIDAPAEAVWQSIVHMNKIDEPIALPFRLGVAYPLSGEITGEGIGATRLGVFSTGTAVERVTEWETNRKLAFVVTKDIPGLRELSPYEHVHAPHVIGYFRTTNTSFELQQLNGDRTQVIERTAHELRLDPVIYWLPLARWVVDLNNGRVLAHLKHQAEGQTPRYGAVAKE